MTFGAPLPVRTYRENIPPRHLLTLVSGKRRTGTGRGTGKEGGERLRRVRRDWVVEHDKSLCSRNKDEVSETDEKGESPYGRSETSREKGYTVERSLRKGSSGKMRKGDGDEPKRIMCHMYLGVHMILYDLMSKQQKEKVI